MFEKDISIFVATTWLPQVIVTVYYHRLVKGRFGPGPCVKVHQYKAQGDRCERLLELGHRMQQTVWRQNGLD